eukprot:CAMPEP_0170242476 /NCGR_PEP_ID=MMETSP0116_2-20130129/21009_1 /TAXON_ID=400756 /ORGANISM="Durinskia baltica, Strain CSIRO CS-38" /LENGTH=94 /DNA_ID=CAMNT_0010493321 /DNA_START=59 /DNA_END=340 /DNA_ORIENTATION=-
MKVAACTFLALSGGVPAVAGHGLRHQNRHAPRKDSVFLQKLPMDADDFGGYEYGDRMVHARDADSSDYSPEQFLRADDGRDGMSKTADMSAATE